MEVLLLNGDAILGQNRNFGFPPPLATPRTFPTMSGNVILPLSYPNYTPEVTPHACLTAHLQQFTPCLTRGCACTAYSCHSGPASCKGHCQPCYVAAFLALLYSSTTSHTLTP